MAKKQAALIPTDQDIQLLLRVRNSQFMKSTELCEHALRVGIAKSKPPFYARMEKLIKGGLVEVIVHIVQCDWATKKEKGSDHRYLRWSSQMMRLQFGSPQLQFICQSSFSMVHE